MTRSRSPRGAPAGWTRSELAALRPLNTPGRIQAFVDALAYRSEDAPACPRRVLAERRAHCYDGALLAAGGRRTVLLP